VAQKAEAIGVLVGMAAAFFADQAAVPLIIEGAEAIVRSPAMTGLDWSQSGATAGTPAGFALHPAAVRAQTQLLRGYASALRAHGAAFQAGVRGLSF
jgi:hypothetical protein